MSKTLIGIIIAAVVLVGGYFAFNKNKVADMMEAQNNIARETSATSPTEKKMAFNEFIKSGGSYKCEVKQAMSDMENSGTVYIDGEKLRGEFSTIAEGKTMDTSFVMKDGYSYTWSSASPAMGFKMKINTDAKANSNASTSGTYSWSAEQIGDYNCEAWTVDQSKFSLPSNVTFRDMSSMGAQ